jgi:hypothetical protein
LRKIYAWRRFWVRESADLFLEDDAYLPDPESEFARFLNPGIATLGDICAEPCSILLGEAGVGKSRSLRTEFEGLIETWAPNNETGALIDIGSVTSLTDLRTLLLADGRVRSWIDSAGIFHLGLDSLDEALPTYPGLPKALIDLIRGLPKDRLRLAIACRSGEFPPYLDGELEAYFGLKGVKRWYMAPLRHRDVQLAATENGLNADSFLHAVRDREVQPLAARPLTLNLLLGEATLGSELLPDLWLLYERGCRRLLAEHSDSFRFNQPQTTDLDQKMAIAGRIACVTIFGAHTVVDISPDSVSQGGSVTSKDIAGGQEIVAGNSSPISDASVRDVLRTGMFSASGSKFKWAHKSYGEFLAAWHLCSNAVSKKQVMSLIGCAGRVAPALQGVTAWLTSRDEDIFQEVLRIDPEVLLVSDLSTTMDLQRAALVTWLLDQAKDGSPLVNEWGLFWAYRKLKHAALKEQLAPLIEGPASLVERHCAIQISEACGGVGLTLMLADLALRGDEPLTLRIEAASCVAHHGEESTKARLLPLALQAAQRSEEERLQAQAFLAVWPGLCTWSQIVDSLGPDDHLTTTPLGRFLGFDFAEGLPASNLAEALGWLAEKNWQPDGLSGWAAATDQLLMRAIDFADDPSIRRAMVDVLFARLSKHHRVFAGVDRNQRDGYPWSAIARRAIAEELIPRLAPKGYLAVTALRSSIPLLDQKDIEFAMDRWEIASPDEKLVWESVIAWLVNWKDPEASLKVLSMAPRRAGLVPLLERHQRDALSHLDSEARERQEQEVTRQGRKDERIDQIHDLLRRAATETQAFRDLLYVMRFPVADYSPASAHPGIHGLPGWEVLTTDEKDRLTAAGKLFLATEHPYTFRGLRAGAALRNTAAGYRLFREFVILDPTYLKDLPEATWKKWIPGIILFQCDLPDAQYGEQDRALLSLAAAKDMGCLTRTLGVTLRLPKILGAARQLQRAVDLLGCDVLDANIFTSLRHPRVPAVTYLLGMRRLWGCSHLETRKILQEALPRVPFASADELPRLALESALWLETCHGTDWPLAFQPMQARPEFAPMLLDVRGPDGEAFDQIIEWLPDQELGDLYLWLRKEFGPPPDFPEITTEPQWRSQSKILAGLQQRRRASSVVILDRIESAYPDDWHVRKATWDAKRLLVEATWEPLTPAGVKRIVEDRRQLLVRDEQELMDAVGEALLDYQSELRAEGSRVMRLWNEPVHIPKREESLSREIGAEIERVLATRGVRITHEVKIREGQFVDIYVSAVTSNSKHRLISLIVEVKGCWHKDLKTALNTQLSMRYLKDNESHFGIYLVVWFLCAKWDGRKDARKRTTPRKTLSEIRTFLDDQAIAVTANSQSIIRAVVLDATIEGLGPELKRPRRKQKYSRTSKKPQTNSGPDPS